MNTGINSSLTAEFPITAQEVWALVAVLGGRWRFRLIISLLVWKVVINKTMFLSIQANSRTEPSSDRYPYHLPYSSCVLCSSLRADREGPSPRLGALLVFWALVPWFSFRFSCSVFHVLAVRAALNRSIKSSLSSRAEVKILSSQKTCW